jgi:hypothetical protein
MSTRRYGWVRDLPDLLDRQFSLAGPVPKLLPPSQLRSCSANAIAATLEFDAARQKLPVATPSRQFIY